MAPDVLGAERLKQRIAYRAPRYGRCSMAVTSTWKFLFRSRSEIPPQGVHSVGAIAAARASAWPAALGRSYHNPVLNAEYTRFCWRRLSLLRTPDELFIRARSSSDRKTVGLLANSGLMNFFEAVVVGLA